MIGWTKMLLSPSQFILHREVFVSIEWAPKINQAFLVKPKNVYDPYGIGLCRKIRGKIDDKSPEEHSPREISRFAKFYLEYRGTLSATVREMKFRKSCLRQGNLDWDTCWQRRKVKLKCIVTVKWKNIFLYFIRSRKIFQQK